MKKKLVKKKEKEAKKKVTTRGKTIITPTQTTPSNSGNSITREIKKMYIKNPKPKKSMFGWICFTEFNEMFKLGKRRGILYSDLKPLAKEIRARRIRRESNRIVQRLADENIDFDELEDVADVIFSLIKPKMKRAIILKTIQNTLSIVISLSIKQFLPEVKKIEGKEPNHKVMLACVFIAGFVTLVKAIVAEHYKKLMCQVGAITAQTLRVLLFDKISNANFSFLKNADSSLLTKLILFEFGSFTAFINRIPDVFSFPYIFLASTAAMVHFLSFLSITIFVIFVIAWCFLASVMKKTAAHTQRQRFFSSKRSLLINEILGKFLTVKQDCLENFLKGKVQDLRNQEMGSLASIHYLKSITNFILGLTPLLSTLTILGLEHKLKGATLDLTTTFTIISLIYQMNNPFKKFVRFMMSYREYLHAKTCINNFLFVIGNKPDDTEMDVELKLGSLSIENCSTEIEQDDAMIEVLEGIFGGNVDFQKERKKVRERMKKRQMRLKNTKMKGKIDEEMQIEETEAPVEKEGKTLLDLKYLLEDNRKEVHFEMDLEVKSKQKVCVSGVENSGIDELFYSILGETCISLGSIRFNGKIVYTDANNPVFIPGKSIRYNITMGEVFCKERYEKITKKIGLNFSNFYGRDQTEVLTGGINLSATEKRKLLLSRIVYIGGDIFILNNFFGYQESEKEREQLKILLDELLGNKTVLFNSNDEELMEICDKIIVMDQGRLYDMKDFKNYKYLQMIAKGKKEEEDVEDMIMKLEKDKFKENSQNIKLVKKIKKDDSLSVSGLFEASKNFSDSKILREKIEKKERKILHSLGEINPKKSQRVAKLTSKWDTSNSFRNLFSKLFKYIFLKGKSKIIFQFLMFFISSIIAISMDLWIGIWSNKVFKLKVNYYIGIYFTLAIFGGIFIIIRDRSFTTSLRQNSEAVHFSTISKVFKMKLRWFTTFSSHNIGLRLTNNIKAIDNDINDNIHDLFQEIGYLIGGMLIVNYVYTGTMLPPTVILLLYLISVFKTYIRTSTTLIKFIGKNTGEMTAVFGTAVHEMINYRSMGKLNILDDQFCEASNELQRSIGHYGLMSKRWLAMRLMIVKTLLVVVAYTIPIVIVFYLKGYFHKPLIEFAIAISWSFKSIDHFNATNSCILRLIALIVNYGVIENLNENIQVEERKGKQGKIKEKIKNPVEMRRVEISLGGKRVLRNINLKIKAKEKLAIVGESGSGKHVLFNIMMKIYERDKIISKERSEIKVLGYDLDKTDCSVLRKEISVLSGNPVVFAGTTRQNIDPEYLHTDEAIMNILWRLNSSEIFGNSVLGSLVNSMLTKSERVVKKKVKSETSMEKGKEIPDSERYLGDTGKTEGDLLKLRKFLECEIGFKQMTSPLSYRKVIKIVKAVLENPKILLIDQNALTFKKGSFSKNLKILEKLLPNSTFIINMNKFGELLELNKIIYMKDGLIIEEGDIRELILNRESLIGNLIKYLDMDDFDDLYNKVGGNERDRDIRKARLKILEEERKKKLFTSSKTDLKSNFGLEYSDHTLKSKLQIHKNRNNEVKNLATVSEKCSNMHSKRDNQSPS